jgi:thiol-disulfide isomerase/thioredoxin
MIIHTINGEDSIRSFVSQQKLTLLDFGANWCGPCKMLKQKILEKETDELMPKLVFVYIDVDNEMNESIANLFSIQALPTQIFVDKDMNVIGRIEGYNFDKFKQMYNSWKILM